MLTVVCVVRVVCGNGGVCVVMMVCVDSGVW